MRGRGELWIRYVPEAKEYMRNKKKDEITIRSSAAEYLTYIASVGDQADSIEMRYEDENIWLTQKMMATLYDVDVRTINYHIKKIFSDSELQENSVIQKFRITAADGKTYNTRAGDFVWSVNAGGTLTLCTNEGYPVLDSNNQPINLPAGISAEKVIVSENGKMGYTNAAGTYVDMNQTIGLFQFNNPGGLEKTGTNLLAVTPASGNAMNESTTANLTKSKVLQKYLEGSNVQVADEMVNLIIAQRAYQLNSKAITTSDEMLEQANNLKR